MIKTLDPLAGLCCGSNSHQYFCYLRAVWDPQPQQKDRSRRESSRTAAAQPRNPSEAGEPATSGSWFTLHRHFEMVSSQQQPGQVLLSVRNLSRTVDKQPLWRGISFDICRGDVWFLRGPSGVGKTLLLRALSCLDSVEVSRPMQPGSTRRRLCLHVKCIQCACRAAAHGSVLQ